MPYFRSYKNNIYWSMFLTSLTTSDMVIFQCCSGNNNIKILWTSCVTSILKTKYIKKALCTGQLFVLIWDIKHELLFKLNYYNALVMSQTGIMSQWDKWCNASVYVSVIQRLMVCTSSVPFALTVHLLSACHQHALPRAANRFMKAHAMC